MSDNSSPFLAPPIVPVSSGLNDAQITTAKSAYVKAGYSQEAIDAAFTNARSAPRPTVSQTDLASKTSITPRELVSGAEALRKHWTGPPEHLEAALKGITAPVRPTREDPFVPGEAATDYTIHWPHNLVSTTEPAEMMRINSETKAAFRAANVPLAHAQALATSLADSSELTAGMNEQQLSDRNRAVVAAVERVFPGQGDTPFEKARTVARSLGTATFEKLRDTGAFRSPQVIVLLNSVADAIAFRKANTK